MTGNTAANGLFHVSVTGTNAFNLEGSSGNGAYTGVGTWTRVTGPSPTAKDIEETGAEGRIHFSITVDPTNENIVYVGGDRQEQPNVIGDNNFGGASSEATRASRVIRLSPRRRNGITLPTISYRDLTRRAAPPMARRLMPTRAK